MSLVKDKKILVLGIILIVFTIIYFIIANQISYAFEPKYDVEAAYEATIETIKKSAEYYATNNPDIFAEQNVKVIKVQDLIDQQLYTPNSQGDVSDPINNEETLNEKRITIRKETDGIVVTIDK